MHKHVGGILFISNLFLAIAFSYILYTFASRDVLLNEPGNEVWGITMILSIACILIYSITFGVNITFNQLLSYNNYIEDSDVLKVVLLNLISPVVNMIITTGFLFLPFEFGIPWIAAPILWIIFNSLVGSEDTAIFGIHTRVYKYFRRYFGYKQRVNEFKKKLEKRLSLSKF